MPFVRCCFDGRNEYAIGDTVLKRREKYPYAYLKSCFALNARNLIRKLFQNIFLSVKICDVMKKVFKLKSMLGYFRMKISFTFEPCLWV